MKNENCKILILSDLNNSTSTILKSTVSLANMLNGDIEFFHVKKAIDVVEKESQLSAFRTINEEQSTTKKVIQNFIKPIIETYGVDINFSYSFGNVKNEIGEYISKHKPDIIVLGKKKPKAFNILGDSITQFVLKKHKGLIMIAANNNALEPNNNLSLGLLNDVNGSLEYVKKLVKHSKVPLKSFKIANNSDILSGSNLFEDKKTIEYVFEKSDNTIANISNYLSKNNINLLCVNRDNKKATNKLSLMESDIKEVINKLNVSLLFSGAQTITKQEIFN